jgi:hypothetical protein
MIGQFLEFSVAARPLADSFEFYRSLGFSSVPVGDTLAHPYLALFDGAIAIGLHDREQPSPLLTFVRPDVRDYVHAVRRAGIALDYAHLSNDEFNRVGLHDPCDQPLELIEARTFPPGEWHTDNVSACGRFLEYSIPAPELETAAQFWRSLGFVIRDGGDAPHRWQRLEGHGVVLGLHAAHFKPGLTFRAPHLDARLAYLKAKGIASRQGNPLAGGEQFGATLIAPEGTPLYLFDAADG